ncbi:hypothetical protein NLJ89_g3690 [Agrocybe chaxingu]|uniref:Terpene synthase n=1 Tax=Agrocybe chaxingu TaxID=84603 RepID=A0A9W8K487_9AGAR|nr:hypothetical protein NLJ89_g3690 [Agrocybe chaxingu]
MNIFWVFDEYFETGNAEETRRKADIVMDALHNPHKPRPSGEWAGGQITREFWLNFSRAATPSAQKRFIQSFQIYTDSVVEQSADRDAKHIRDIDSFLALRQRTIGVAPSYIIGQMYMDLPDYAVEHPAIHNLARYGAELIFFENDLYSYDIEQSRGESDHNLVTVIMKQLGLTEQEAFDWIGRLHEETVEKFLLEYQKVPKFEDERVTKGTADYVSVIGTWVRANDQWHFETRRYFGKDGLRVQNERTISLSPKVF